MKIKLIPWGKPPGENRNIDSLDTLIESEPELKEYLEQAGADLQDKIGGSLFTMTINPKDEKIDPKIALETGYSILFNKPIVVIAKPGQKILPGLARVAHAIVYVSDPPTEDDRDRLREAILMVERDLKGGKI